MVKQYKLISIKGLKDSQSEFELKLTLLPNPKELIQDGMESYLLNTESYITFHNVDSPNLFYKDLNEYLDNISSFQITEKSYKKEKVNYNDDISLSLPPLLDSPFEDMYNLIIKENTIVIYSNYEKGLFYGLQTLIQILKNNYLSLSEKNELKNSKADYLAVPKLIIRDTSDFMIRGIAQDISRGQVFTTDNAKRVLHILSHYKMNFYCIYIEDMFSHPKYPEIGKGRGALTKEEIKNIDDFAKERFIEFVPIFESLGHVDNILTHEKYESLGEYPGSQCFNTQNKDLYPFLENQISELSKSFSAKYFHVGCDESFDLGKYRSKESVSKIGKSQLYLQFYENLYQIVTKFGNENIIIYDDIIVNDEKILKSLRKDYILMQWDYVPRKKYPKIKKIINAGYKVIISPSMLNWQRHFPDFINSSKNVYSMVREAFIFRDKGCLGFLNSTWGDFRYYSFRENEILGAIYGGALAWNFQDFDDYNFLKNYGFLFYGIERTDLDRFSNLIISLSSSVALYYHFSILLPSFFYMYLFKHPFPSINYKSSFKKYKKFGSIVNSSFKEFNQLKDKIKFERNNFNYIGFSCELARLLCLKIEISGTITHKLRNKVISDTEIDEIIQKLKYVRQEFISTKKKYEELWLSAAKRPCLEVNLNLFDFVIECYDKKINELQQGIFFQTPYLPSEWIWVHEKYCPPLPRYFRKIIHLNKPVKQAVIEVLASTFMNIYINGDKVGNVSSRFSLSILPIVKRVKLLDISKQLHVGRNQIAIEAYNFEGYMGAINLYGQILYDDGTLDEILSDKTWFCYAGAIKEGKNWFALDFNDSNWKKVKSYGISPKLNGDLFKSDILKGKKTITQDYFGMQTFFFNAIKTFLGYFLGRLYKIFGKLLLTIIKWIVNFIIRRIKPYD